MNSAALKIMEGVTEMMIGARRVPGTRFLSVFDPSTGEAFAEAPDATDAQTDAAIEAAATAFPGWSARRAPAVGALRIMAAVPRTGRTAGRGGARRRQLVLDRS